jgi:amidase
MEASDRDRAHPVPQFAAGTPAADRAHDAPRRGADSAAALPELVRMGALELSRTIKARRVSCREVMTAFLDHIERINPKVNAIVSLQERGDLLGQASERDAQLSRGEDMGWMHGLPHAVKDLAATAGIRTTSGSELLDGVPREDDLFVRRMRRCGAIFIGKTNTPEFGLGSQTYNAVFGTTRNAYDPTRTAGGSSGGAAVSLALCMQPVADGSDMMGSLRNPAAFNNVFGFRPSYGRVPYAGGELFVEQLSVDGPMGRSVTDVALLLSVMAGPHAGFPASIEQDPSRFAEPLQRDVTGARLGWLGDLDGHLALEPGVRELCESALAAFRDIGCRVELARLDYPPEKLWKCWLTLRHWLNASYLAPLYTDPARRRRIKPEARWEVEGGLGLTAREVYAASEARSDAYRALQRLFEHYDFLEIHWPKSIDGTQMDTYHRWMEVVIPASLTGCPAMSVPVGFNRERLPMGLQIIGRNHADLSVLQIAHAYDEATRWVQRVPPPLLARS